MVTRYLKLVKTSWTYGNLLGADCNHILDRDSCGSPSDITGMIFFGSRYLIINIWSDIYIYIHRIRCYLNIMFIFTILDLISWLSEINFIRIISFISLVIWNKFWMNSDGLYFLLKYQCFNSTNEIFLYYRKTLF